jgi:hypothetical protein
MKRAVRHFIQRLSPYGALVLLAAPTITVEMLKVAAVFFLGDGHLATGLVAMICAYTFSFFVTERLFRIVRPKLIRLPWFKRIWSTFVSARRKTFVYMREKWAGARNVLSQ